MSILNIDPEPSLKVETNQPQIGQQNSELQFELLQPFGPTIGHFFLDSPTFVAIYKAAKKILTDKKREQYGEHLAGMIEDEPSFRLGADNQNIYESFEFYAVHYMQQYMLTHGYKSDDIQCTVSEAWLVNQKPGEYNPAHTHGNCNVSGVMYLEVPEIKYNEKLHPRKGEQQDGKIDFINNSMRELWELEQGALQVSPVPGHLFVFPSRLTHTVYPYQLKPAKERTKGSPTSRLSLSFNAQVWVGKDMGITSAGFISPEHQGVGGTFHHHHDHEEKVGNDDFYVEDNGQIKRKRKKK